MCNSKLYVYFMLKHTNNMFALDNTKLNLYYLSKTVLQTNSPGVDISINFNAKNSKAFLSVIFR